MAKISEEDNEKEVPSQSSNGAEQSNENEASCSKIVPFGHMQVTTVNAIDDIDDAKLTFNFAAVRKPKLIPKLRFKKTVQFAPEVKNLDDERMAMRAAGFEKRLRDRYSNRFRCRPMRDVLLPEGYLLGMRKFTPTKRVLGVFNEERTKKEDVNDNIDSYLESNPGGIIKYRKTNSCEKYVTSIVNSFSNLAIKCEKPVEIDLSNLQSTSKFALEASAAGSNFASLCEQYQLILNKPKENVGPKNATSTSYLFAPSCLPKYSPPKEDDLAPLGSAISKLNLGETEAKQGH